MNTLKIKGELTKQQFYLVLDHIDEMKSDGFYFTKQDRKDLPNGNVKIDYRLNNK
jgi:hypothetical protein